MVQGAGKVDPIAAWHSMTQPKPLLEPANVLAACDQMVGTLDHLIFEAELESGILDPGATGDATWLVIDNRLDDLVAELGSAQSIDDLQDVGRRCRDLIIAVGKLLADHQLVPEGQPMPKRADPRAWMDLYLAAKAPGPVLDDFRHLIRSTWKAAQGVTHGEVLRSRPMRLRRRPFWSCALSSNSRRFRRNEHAVDSRRGCGLVRHDGAESSRANDRLVERATAGGGEEARPRVVTGPLPRWS